MKLFIDDIRYPIDNSWTIARSSKEAIDLIASEFPLKISFDHDLGGDDTAMQVVNYIINGVLDGVFQIPEDFEYTVHSANPVGAINIANKLNSFLKFLQEN